MKMLSPASILVVDDSPTNLNVLLELLEASEYKVTLAKNGENALNKAKRTQPDLILLDVLMPGIDGFETCRRLKADRDTHRIPVIFMSALSETVNKVKGLQIGAVDYITKPFDHEEVLARIRVHLNLKTSQLQLVQESGLSALGQLVAGIAREINNPINFVYGNLAYAAQYHREMVRLLELYEARYPYPSPEIEDWQEQIDLPFLIQDYVQLLDSMRHGAERIKGIVTSLRSLAKLDEVDYKLTDLHEGLESALILIDHRLHAKTDRGAIQVIKQYGDLPLIPCYPARVNQAVMNLLVNAIDAIDERAWQCQHNGNKTMPTPQLILSTHLEITSRGKWVRLHCADNGVGMSEAVQQQMFEQFFTTKWTGKGTGLGLSIAKQIIEDKHGGAIACHSELGKGTEFIISLPLN